MKKVLTTAIAALALTACASSHEKFAANDCLQTVGSTRLDAACAKAKNFGS